MVRSPAVPAIAAAAAAAFLVTRWLTFLNRWEFLRVEFKDPFLAVAQVVTVLATLIVMEELSFTHVVVSLALADLSMAVAVLIDRLIVAASLWPPPQRRR
jgi:hypothetical protein